MLWTNIKNSWYYKYAFNAYSRFAFYLSTLWPSPDKYTVRERCGMLIITIAYNNEQLIERQIELIRKNIKDQDYQYVVADNSPNRRKRKVIKQICQKNNIAYISIPPIIDKFIFQCGISHGAALNWVYYHYLRKVKPNCFSLIDHDIFPVKAFDMSSALGKNDFYGVSRVFNGEWYLWPGWCIFQFDKFTAKPNFLPVFTKKSYLDTGGSNYTHFFIHYNLKDISFPDVKTKRIKVTEGLTTHCDIYHSDCIQIVDDAWLHLINGSNYAHIPGKEDTINKMLAKIDEKQEF